MKCCACGGPASPTTGWVLSPRSILCGPCARDFASWYRGRMGRQNHSRGSGCFNEAAAKSITGTKKA